MKNLGDCTKTEDKGGNLHTQDFIKVKNASGSEDVHYSVFYEGIPEKLLLEAQKTLNETEENKRKGMNALRAFAKRKHLRSTEDDLLLILRTCKYDLKKSEQKLKNYLRLRQKVLNLVSKMDDNRTNAILDDIILCILPYRDKYGRVTFVSRPNIHLDRYDPDDGDPVFLSFALYIITQPFTTVTGVNYVAECKSDSIYVFYPIVKQFRKSFLSLATDLPVRVGKIDIVNENFLVRWCYNIVSPFVPEKIASRVTFHGSDYEKLKAYYNPEILFEEFGGNLGPFNDKHFREGLLNFMHNLREESKRLQENKL